jgi:hypothetical protein
MSDLNKPHEINPSVFDKEILGFLQKKLPDGFAFVLIATPLLKGGDNIGKKTLKIFSNSEEQMPVIIGMAAATVPGVPKLPGLNNHEDDEGEEWKRG